MTPFEAVYGCSPPSLLDYLAGHSSIASLDDLLQSRTHILATLKFNLQRAQNRMQVQANSHRTDVNFDVHDWVFLKLQPYRQSTVAHRKFHKLANHFFGPFQITE